MVKETKKGENVYYMCEECGLLYKEKNMLLNVKDGVPNIRAVILK